MKFLPQVSQKSLMNAPLIKKGTITGQNCCKILGKLESEKLLLYPSIKNVSCMSELSGL